MPQPCREKPGVAVLDVRRAPGNRNPHATVVHWLSLGSSVAQAGDFDNSYSAVAAEHGVLAEQFRRVERCNEVKTRHQDQTYAGDGCPGAAHGEGS